MGCGLRSVGFMRRRFEAAIDIDFPFPRPGKRGTVTNLDTRFHWLPSPIRRERNLATPSLAVWCGHNECSALKAPSSTRLNGHKNPPEPSQATAKIKIGQSNRRSGVKSGRYREPKKN